MVSVRKDLDICLGRGATKIPLLTELRTRDGWRLRKKFGLEILPPPNGNQERFDRNRSSKSFGATNTKTRPDFRCSSSFSLARFNKSVLAVW